jgi:cysteine-rich repeat protein
MKNGKPFQALIVVSLLMPFTACSNLEPVTCDDGSQCPHGSTCSKEGTNTICIDNDCGNGIYNHAEECDDGNRTPGDGCSPKCKFEYCGDGITTSAREECDDANNTSGDGCSSDCQNEYCGDGIMNNFIEGQPAEECEPGHTPAEIHCSEECRRLPSCGDGILDPGESCDCGRGAIINPGCNGTQNSDDGGLCSTDCTQHCGNGKLDPGEGCDGDLKTKEFCAEMGFDMGTLGCAGCELQTTHCKTLTVHVEPVDSAYLHGIWGASVSTVFIVGEDSSANGEDSTIYRFDGSAWTSEPHPNIGKLFDVWGYATNDVFAAGKKGDILHYDGFSWTSYGLPDGEDLQGIWGTTANDVSDVFAVGLKGTILHYDGGAWSSMPSDSRSKDLRDVWGTDSTNVYAVGKEKTVLHYAGDKWTQVALPLETPPDGKVEFMSIWGTGPSDIFVVGHHGKILHFDGVKWTWMVSPTRNALFDVWGTGPSDVFAAGRSGTILHYDGTTWASVRSDTDIDFNAGWATSTEIFIAGQDGEIHHFTRD